MQMTDRYENMYKLRPLCCRAMSNIPLQLNGQDNSYRQTKLALNLNHDT